MPIIAEFLGLELDTLLGEKRARKGDVVGRRLPIIGQSIRTRVLGFLLSHTYSLVIFVSFFFFVSIASPLRMPLRVRLCFLRGRGQLIRVVIANCYDRLAYVRLSGNHVIVFKRN